MKANITIKFKEIIGKKVDKSLLEKNPKLPEATKRTLELLCQKLKLYFKEQKIKTKISFHLENE